MVVIFYFFSPVGVKLLKASNHFFFFSLSAVGLRLFFFFFGCGVAWRQGLGELL